MSGMEPMLIGAALGGGLSAARGGNPITGALLGGIGGGVFGAASGAAGAASGASQAAGIAANPALSYGAANTAAGSTMASPSLLTTMKNIPSALNTFAKENPFTTGVATEMLKQEFQSPPVIAPTPAGLLRGSQIPMEQQQYAMAPRQQISLI